MLGNATNHAAQIKASHNEKIQELRSQGYYVVNLKQGHPDYYKDNLEFQTLNNYEEVLKFKASVPLNKTGQYEILNPTASKQ